jgi:Kef-type K+ transport system membrane component KefB
MMTFDTMIFLFVFAIILFILSKFIKGKLFDYFSSKKTGKFTFWSALYMAFAINLLVGIIGVTVDWIANNIF